MAGAAVYLRIGGPAAGHHGAFHLAVSCGPAPSNDTCANPIPLQVGLNGPFSNVGASDDYPPQAAYSYCGYLGQASWSPGYSEVWFSWTATSGAQVQIRLCPLPTGFAPFLSVRSACGGIGGELNCTANCWPGTTVYVTGGTTYLIRVGSIYGMGWNPGVIQGQGQFTIWLTGAWALNMTSPFGPGSISMQSLLGDAAEFLLHRGDARAHAADQLLWDLHPDGRAPE